MVAVVVAERGLMVIGRFAAFRSVSLLCFFFSATALCAYVICWPGGLDFGGWQKTSETERAGGGESEFEKTRACRG